MTPISRKVVPAHCYWIKPLRVTCTNGGADPLVRGRRPRRPIAVVLDDSSKSGSGGTRADQGGRPTKSARFLLAFSLLAPALAASGGLRIEALRGDGANNNPALGVTVSPAVRLLDASGKAVPKALIVFTGPAAGPSVEFGSEGATAEAVTDESGVAIAPRLRPVGGNGPVEIRIMASRGGEFAHFVVHQMNLGVDAAAGREAELSLVKLPEPAGSPRPSSRQSALRVKIEDGNGRPVASANVLFILRKFPGGGKMQEVSRALAQSDSAGEAAGQAPRPSGNVPLEFCVTAVSGGRTVTAYFPVN